MSEDEFRNLAEAGYYVGIRVGFAFPLVERNCLPERWIREYTAGGLIVHDPAMAWAYANRGIVRMACLVATDGQGVLELARHCGLNHGAVASVLDPDDPGERSFGFFYRSDRAFEDHELLRLEAALAAAHRVHRRPRNMTAAELETLSLVKNGMLTKQIASALGVSESAIKQRLRSARFKLGAKTGSQAAAKAVMLGMI